MFCVTLLFDSGTFAVRFFMGIDADQFASVALRIRYFKYDNRNCFRYVACEVKYAYFVIIYFTNKTPKDIFCQIRYEF